MINVSDEIKEMYMDDDTEKIIRITFLDGSLPDITNELVAESVRFTEQVSSGDGLTLGVAEASVLEFQCTNYPNFRGKRIKAFSEVGGEQVSLGVFTVDECKRQDDLITRNVVAYSAANLLNLPTGNEVLQNTYEAHRRSVDYYSDVTYDSELKKWLKMMASASLDPEDTLPSEPDHDARPASSAIEEYTDNCRIEISYGLKRYWLKLPTGTPTGTGSHAGWNDAQGLYFAQKHELTAWDEERQEYVTKECDIEEVIGEAMEFLRANIDDLTEEMDLQLEKDVRNTCANIVTSRRRTSSSGSSYKTFSTTFPVENYVYPYIRGVHTGYSSYAGYTTIEFHLIEEILIRNVVTGEVFSKYFNLNKKLMNVDTTAYSNIDSVVISIPRTKVGSLYKTIIPDDFSFYEIAKSYATFDAAFGRFDRESGNLIFRQLGTGDPIEVSTSDYASIEYDEEQTVYTSVRSSYKGSTGEPEEYIAVINADMDNNPYYVNDNYLFNGGYMTAAQVQEITDNIASVIGSYRYVPCNIVMRGVPYMEAGDNIQIQLRNGETIAIPVLRRTMSGIRLLQDSIDIM